MDTIGTAVRILTETEKALAALASEAAKRSDYDAAAFLIEVAREIAELGTTTSGRTAPATAKQQSSELESLRNGAHPGHGRALGPKTKRGTKSEYPRFLREGENLVKIGWSPSDKSEYEHKCPKKVLALLASAISKAGAHGKRFTMEVMLPLTDPDTGAKVPDYQTYLCLAWLRLLGFVIQHGRQGYSLATKAPIESLFETHWANLPTR